MNDESYTAQDVIRDCPGLTYRRLDYWCRKGCFGEERALIGSGTHRHFSETDLAVAKAINRTSLAFEPSTGRIALLPIYKLVADAIRQNNDKIHVELAPGIDLYINLAGSTERQT